MFEPPVEIPGFTKRAVWHERTHRDPGHRWARSLLFETCTCLEADRKPDRRVTGVSVSA